MAGRARILRVILMLEQTAGEPRDMGLSEQELCPDPLTPLLIPAAAVFFIRDPGARLRRAFSPSVTGDIWASILMRDRLKAGTETGALLKCGGVFSPATSVAASGTMLD